MRLTCRPLVLVLLAFTALVASAPGAAAQSRSPILAIADQKPDFFSDPLLQPLKNKRSRLFVPWDAINRQPERLDAWLGNARRARVEPLVAFEKSSNQVCPGRRCKPPSVRAYRSAFKKFRRRYPYVRLVQPWNEANSPTQPTGRNPRRAAEFYNVVRAECRRCTVPAADLLDATNMVRWLRTFRRTARGNPKLWGLHNYGDVNRFRSTQTRLLLRTVPGEVWLTETGGLVRFETQSGRVPFPYNERRAAKATRYLLQLARRERRIKRIYYYQWRIDNSGNRFDSALVAANGDRRASYREVYRNRRLIR